MMWEGRYCKINKDLWRNHPRSVMSQDIRPAHLNSSSHLALKKCFADVLPNPSLGTSDHSLVIVKDDAKRIAFPDMAFFRTIFRYTSADWYNFISYLTEPPLSNFKHNASSRLLSSQNGYFWNVEFYTPENMQAIPGSPQKVFQS